MAVQRYISSSFWSDDWVDSLTGLEKLLYMYLLTNECTSICGVYKITIKRMKDDTGIPREEVLRMLNVFAEAKKAFYFEEYIILPKWLKHQNINSPKVRLGTVRSLRALPENIINFLKEENHFYYNIDDLLIEKSGSNKNEAPGSKTIPYPENEIPYTENAEKPDTVCQKTDTIYPKDGNSDDNFNSNLNSYSNLSSLDILPNQEIPANCQAEPSADEPPPTSDVLIPDKKQETRQDISQEAQDLAMLLYTEHKKLDPNFSKPKKHIEKWACDIEKLHRLDKRPYTDIEAVIRWIKTSGNFWNSNIISGSKLREKFDTVFMQMQQDFKKQHPPFNQNDFSKQDFSESSIPEALRSKQKIEFDIGEALESVPF